MQSYPQFLSMLRKPLLFGLYGALGCFLAALLVGEPLLYFTRMPPPPVEKLPQAVVLLIDYSGSMDGNKLIEVKTAATRFIKRQDFSRNQFAAIGFGSNIHTPTALGAPALEIESGINNIVDGGGTDMARGLKAAVNALKSSESNSMMGASTVNRGILLFTDGVPNSKSSTIRAAVSARAKGINIVVVSTGGADVKYLAKLTGNRALVFYANSGQFDQAFQRAEKQLSNNQLIESGPTGQYGLLASLIRTGSWTGLLAIGTSISLIFGQNRYMRRRRLTSKEASVAFSGGCIAGLVAGAFGQLLFMPTASLGLVSWGGKIFCGAIAGTLSGALASMFTSQLTLRTAALQGSITGAIGAIGISAAVIFLGDFWTYGLLFLSIIILIKSRPPTARVYGLALGAAGIVQSFYFIGITPSSSVETIGRVAGWIILGLFLGGGMSAFIPNLQFRRALLGGGVGGFVGAVMFILISGVAGDLLGRLLGAAALGFFIGLMIAILEQLAINRQAALIVHWPGAEKTKLVLGQTPVILGSSQDAHVYLPRKTYPSILAKVYLHNQEVIMEFDKAMQEQSSMKILRHVLKHGDTRKFGNIQVEIQVMDSSVKPNHCK